MKRQKLTLTKVGKTGKTFGYKGEILFFVEEEYEELIQEGLFLFINREGNRVPYQLESVHWANECRIKINGVDAVEDAKVFTTSDVYIDASVIGDILKEKEDPKGWRDLESYKIMDQNQIEIGFIDYVDENPHQILAYVILSNGKEVIIPIHESLIISLDEIKKEVQVEIAEGLLDL